VSSHLTQATELPHPQDGASGPSQDRWGLLPKQACGEHGAPGSSLQQTSPPPAFRRCPTTQPLVPGPGPVQKKNLVPLLLLPSFLSPACSSPEANEEQRETLAFSSLAPDLSHSSISVSLHVECKTSPSPPAPLCRSVLNLPNGVVCQKLQSWVTPRLINWPSTRSASSR